MTMRRTIALASPRVAATFEEGVAAVQRLQSEAAERGAMIVCFPEAYLPGLRGLDFDVYPWDRALQERALAAVASSAREHGIATILGIELITDHGRQIAAAVIGADGELVGMQVKTQLDPSEERNYVPGTGRRLFEIDGLKFGVVICHEGWRYPETVRWAARRGAHVVFHPHFHEAEPGGYRPTSFADPMNTFHEKAMLCRAAENGCYFASVNCASDGSPTTSAVVRPDGTVLAWQPYGQEGLLVADLDTAAATGLLAARCRSG
jgi:predicted amidohydrolase